MDQEIAAAALRAPARHGGGPGHSLGGLAGEGGGWMVTVAVLANTDAPELGMRVAAAMLEAAWTG